MATARDSFYGDYVNGFAFLGGGLDAAGAQLKAVDVFNDSLARTDGFTLSVGGNSIQAMAIGDFVIFACGWGTAASSVASAFTVI